MEAIGWPGCVSVRRAPSGQGQQTRRGRATSSLVGLNFPCSLAQLASGGIVLSQPQPSALVVPRPTLRLSTHSSALCQAHKAALQVILHAEPASEPAIKVSGAHANTVSSSRALHRTASPTCSGNPSNHTRSHRQFGGASHGALTPASAPSAPPSALPRRMPRRLPGRLPLTTTPAAIYYPLATLRTITLLHHYITSATQSRPTPKHSCYHYTSSTYISRQQLSSGQVLSTQLHPSLLAFRPTQHQPVRSAAPPAQLQCLPPCNHPKTSLGRLRPDSRSTKKQPSTYSPSTRSTQSA